MDSIERKCLNCGAGIEGRRDKKYCDNYCKSQFHYDKAVKEKTNRYQFVMEQLKKNRRVLAKFNKAGLAKVDCGKLIAEGFDPLIFTNYWKNKKGEVYLFCFEYGFLKKGGKYVLVEWQGYMGRD